MGTLIVLLFLILGGAFGLWLLLARRFTKLGETIENKILKPFKGDDVNEKR